MGWIKSFRNSDGSIDSYDWSLNMEIGSSVTAGIFMIFGAHFFALIIPTIFFIFLCNPNRVKEVKELSIWIIVMSLFSLFDYSFGWVNWMCLNTLDTVYPFIIALNLTVLILSVIILIIKEKFFDLMEDINSPILSLIFLLFLLYVSQPKVLILVKKFIPMATEVIWA
jgi:hypothetical protein